MNDATIIYCSSNREDPAFEERIQKNILKNRGNLPIVAVTQKSQKYFGGVKPENYINFCVGDTIGASGFNFFRQVQVGLKEIKTAFVISAESDCMYPPDYFTYRPPYKDKCYRNRNLYVMPDQRSYFFLKEEGATHAQIVGTKFYLDTLNELFMGAPTWSAEEKNFPKERYGKEDVFREIHHYKTENPVFQVKTHRGLRYYTHSDRTPIPEIKYWGEGRKMRDYLIYGKDN